MLLNGLQHSTGMEYAQNSEEACAGSRKIDPLRVDYRNLFSGAWC